MLPKEKAKELVDKFSDLEDGEMYIGKAKQFALIAVDEIINCDYFFKTLEDTKEFTKYWVQIQNEINNL